MNSGTTKYAELFYSTVINDIDALERNVKDYPASSVARFLLLYHYKKNALPKLEELAGQTGIYLNNPPWIQYQLLQSESPEESKENDEEITLTVSEEDILTATTAQPIAVDSLTEDFTKEEDKEEHSIETEEEDKENLIIETKEEENPPVITEEPASGDTVENDSDGEQPITFEPLHTVDYFASQGIRISSEMLENDHLGKQVKSFTAWLKSMKKLHPGQVPEQNEVIEKIIQSSSEVSNQSADILTEAMAEVLIKQDKKEKAVEMYQKLSLINPSKSAYFAAKIESLKHN